MIDALFTGDLKHFAPSAILSTTVLLLLLSAAYQRNSLRTGIIAGAGLFISLLVQVKLIHSSNYSSALFTFDGTSHFISTVILICTLLLTAVLSAWLTSIKENVEEYYLLLLLATLGGLAVTASTHFASFFLGLELMGLSLVPMIAYQENSNKALEAGIKYLILSSVASAFMLMAMAIIYLYTGDLSFNGVFSKMSAALATLDHIDYLTLTSASLLMLVGLSFKLSLVPGHLWAADVFEGAPIPTNALLASISKVSVFVVLLRLFSNEAFSMQAATLQVISAIAIASMLVGNLLGIMQKNILRLMAYSSIAHFGYLLLAIIALSPSLPLVSSPELTMLAKESALYYITAYAVTVVAAFSMLIILKPEGSSIQDLSGVFWSKPAASSVFIMSLLSLAGIPLTIGFMGKFYLTTVAINQQNWWLLSSLIAGSIIGLFYYLRIILTLLEKPLDSPAITSQSMRNKLSQGLVMAAFAALIIGLGTFPDCLSLMIQTAVSP